MKTCILSGATALAIGGCAYKPSPLPVIAAQLAPADTAVSSTIVYQDPLAGYTYRGPTGPRDWRTVNEEQSEAN